MSLGDLSIGLSVGILATLAVLNMSGEVDEDCKEADAPRGCWPCLDAAEWHASQWAFAQDNATKTHHQERRDHWLQADVLGADCSGWRETEVAT